MGAKPKGLVARREVRKRLPEAYRGAARWIEARAAVAKIVEDDDVLYLALNEVIDFLRRKADQLSEGGRGR